FSASASVANAGQFNALNDQTLFSRDTTGSFVNDRTFTKSPSNGLTTIQIPFTNNATVDVLSGVLSMQAAYRGPGTWHVGSSGVLDLTGGTTRSISGTYHGTGTGTILLQNGTLAVSGEATFDFPGPLFQWTGGAIQGGTLHNANVMNLSG